LLEIAAEMRADAKVRIADFERRKDVLRAFVESDALDLIRAGRLEEARQTEITEWTEIRRVFPVFFPFVPFIQFVPYSHFASSTY
jgi:hypothetical protein